MTPIIRKIFIIIIGLLTIPILYYVLEALLYFIWILIVGNPYQGQIKRATESSDEAREITVFVKYCDYRIKGSNTGNIVDEIYIEKAFYYSSESVDNIIVSKETDLINRNLVILLNYAFYLSDTEKSIEMSQLGNSRYSCHINSNELSNSLNDTISFDINEVGSNKIIGTLEIYD